MTTTERIGFMQGRLSPVFEGRIQVFPWACWQDEFPIAARHGFRLMEWTLDQDRLYENPLMNATGQAQIRKLCGISNVGIPSLTGDCFMQAPFWKSSGKRREELERDFLEVVEACSAVGIGMIVVPLVDNGRLDDMMQENILVEFLQSKADFLRARSVSVIFECDFVPRELARFIARLDPATFGINYDMGNSAALGFNPTEEFAAYGRRIANVHIKDRAFGGTTVPLGTGNADFDCVFKCLHHIGYQGNYILQTARAVDGDHAVALVRYREMSMDWITRHAA